MYSRELAFSRPGRGVTEHEEARVRLLDAATTLFYQRGIQSVGMDELRAASGLSLKRLYQYFPSKKDIVVAYLLRRDERWRAELIDYVTGHDSDPLTVFDWLAGWFAEPDFRGCAFINSVGELGAISPEVADAALHHKHAVKEFLAGLVHDEDLADQIQMLMDGATTAAAITRDPATVHRARAAAATLLRAWSTGVGNPN